MASLRTWVVVALFAAAPAIAQNVDVPNVASPVVMMDSDRLYTDTKYGQLLRSEIDEKIIQQAVDEKEAELTRAQATARVMFYDQARPIVGQLMVARGAAAVLDSRTSFVWLDSIDITNDAIAAIDAALLPAAE